MSKDKPTWTQEHFGMINRRISALEEDPKLKQALNLQDKDKHARAQLTEAREERNRLQDREDELLQKIAELEAKQGDAFENERLKARIADLERDISQFGEAYLAVQKEIAERYKLGVGDLQMQWRDGIRKDLTELEDAICDALAMGGIAAWPGDGVGCAAQIVTGYTKAMCAEKDAEIERLTTFRSKTVEVINEMKRQIAWLKRVGKHFEDTAKANYSIIKNLNEALGNRRDEANRANARATHYVEALTHIAHAYSSEGDCGGALAPKPMPGSYYQDVAKKAIDAARSP